MSELDEMLEVANRVRDEEILADILAEHHSGRRPLVTNKGGTRRAKSVCALGAGVSSFFRAHRLDAKRNGKDENERDDVHQVIDAVRFATAYHVSDTYAAGVGDGFEGHEVCCTVIERYLRPDRGDSDYRRGWDVGQAVREYVNGTKAYPTPARAAGAKDKSK